MADQLQTVAFPVRIGEGDQLSPVHLEALSAEGLLVRTRRVRAVDDAVRIELDPPDGGSVLALDGRVARIEPAVPGELVAGVEVRFVDLSREAVTRLAALLASCEDLSDRAEAEIDEISVATVLRRRIDNATHQVERADRHLVQLGRALEFARQAERASRTLVEQIEANRSTDRPDEGKVDRIRELAKRRTKLDTELNRRLGANQIRGQIERDLARVDKLSSELEEMRGQLQHTKVSAAQRLQEVGEELEADRDARRQAESARAELEGRLASALAAADVDEVSAETESADPVTVAPPPPPADALDPELEEEVEIDAEEDEDPVDLASAIAGELLPGDEEQAGAGPVELSEPPKPVIPALRPPPKPPAGPSAKPKWAHLLGGTLAGSGVIVGAVVLFLYLQNDNPPVDETPATAVAAETEEVAPPVDESAESATSADESAASDESSEAADEIDAAVVDVAVVDAAESSSAEMESSPDDGSVDTPSDDDEPDLEVAPPTPEERLAAALDLYGRRRFKPALKAFKAAAPGNSRSHEFHAGMGHCLLEAGKAKQALTHLERAVKLKPTSATPYMYLGTAYWEVDRKPDARTAFERFLELAPKSPRAPEIRTLLDNL